MSVSSAATAVQCGPEDYEEMNREVEGVPLRQGTIEDYLSESSYYEGDNSEDFNLWEIPEKLNVETVLKIALVSFVA